MPDNNKNITFIGTQLNGIHRQKNSTYNQYNKSAAKHDVQRNEEFQEIADKSENQCNTSEQNASAKQPKGTVAIEGDSIIYGIREDLLTMEQFKI